MSPCSMHTNLKNLLSLLLLLLLFLVPSSSTARTLLLGEAFDSTVGVYFVMWRQLGGNSAV